MKTKEIVKIFVISFFILSVFFFLLNVDSPGSRGDRLLEKATEKIDAGQTLTPKEIQRIHDALNKRLGEK